MGRIDRLLIENFKSYAHSHVIGPFTNFTAIIGPNGAGKSNLMDAICFVLGLSARSLRGDKLRDLVWASGKGAADASAAKKRTATVSLVYVVDEADAGVESAAVGDEITFSRGITTAGSSVYRINGEDVALDEYVARLDELNVSTKARNFLVFQGDVETIAVKSAKELLRHFEEFSGSDELKEQYDAALKELSEARLEASLKATARKATAGHRKEVKKQKEEADVYAARLAERDRMRVQAMLWKLYHVRERVQVETEALEGAKTALEEATEADEELAESFTSVAKALNKASKDMAAKEKALAAAERAHLKAATQAEEATQQATAAAGRIEELKASLAKLQSQASANAEEIASIESDISAQEDKLAAIEAGKLPGDAAGGKRRKSTSAASAADGPSLVTLDAASRAEYNVLKAQERQRTADVRATQERLKREQLAEDAESNALQGDMDGLTAQRGDIIKLLDEQRVRLAELDAAAKKITVERTEKQRDLLTVRGQLETAKKRHEDLGTELEEVKAQLQTHKDARKKSESDRRMESALEDMRRIFTGVRGRLSDLVQPSQRKYNTAVSVALGRHMDAVVVDTTATAFQCVGWLREHKVRPMLFIPLDSIVTPDVDDKLSTFLSRAGASSPYRLIRDIIRFDPELEAAVHYAVGTAVLCDTLSDARELRYGKEIIVKCITLDGSVVGKNGNMTGGVSTADAELARASRWDEKELTLLQARRDTLLQEEEALRRKLTRARTTVGDTSSLWIAMEDCETAVANANTRLTVVKKQMETRQQAIEAHERDLSAIDAQIQTKRPALERALASIKKRQASSAELQAQVDAIGEEVFSAFSKRLGLSSIRELETEVLARAEAEAKAKREVSDVLTKLRSRLEYERSRDVTEKLAETKAKVVSEEKRMAEHRNREKEARRTMERAKDDEAAAQQELEAVKTALKACEADKESIAKKKRVTAEAKSAAAKQVTAHETTLERMSSQLHEELQHAQTQCITLPVKRGGVRTAAALDDSDADSDEDMPDEEASPAGDARSGKSRDSATGLFSQTITTGSDSQESAGASAAAARTSKPSDADLRRLARIDFSKLEENTNVSADRVEEVATRYERRIHDADLELGKLNPNMRASALLDELDKKYKTESSEYEAARDRQASADKTYSGLRETRRRLFDDAFTHVAGVIDSIYKELTTSGLHPMGGRASLSIDMDHDIFDVECSGIRYNVMPPGKRFRELEMLSGGEKTVAALALLFALHSFRPSPFFIMDEVDAALDNVNVHKVASYIRRRTAPQANGAPPLQAIVISLKDGLYDKASALVGIYRDSAADCSRTLTLDLDAFPGGEEDTPEAPPASERSSMPPGSAGSSLITPNVRATLGFTPGTSTTATSAAVAARR